MYPFNYYSVWWSGNHKAKKHPEGKPTRDISGIFIFCDVKWENIRSASKKKAKYIFNPIFHWWKNLVKEGRTTEQPRKRQTSSLQFTLKSTVRYNMDVYSDLETFPCPECNYEGTKKTMSYFFQVYHTWILIFVMSLTSQSTFRFHCAGSKIKGTLDR